MQKTILSARGLYTFPNQLSKAPPGSLSEADNLVIDREGVLEPRRGFNQLPGTLGSDATDTPSKLFRFDDVVVSHYGPFGDPDTLAFYSPLTVVTGVQSIGSNIITNLNNTLGLYVGQVINIPIIEQGFTGNIALTSNQITNIPFTKGLFIGQSVGGIGIPVNTTITALSGAGPYTATISNPATYTNGNAAFVASNSNILGFPAGTAITVIGVNQITVSNVSTRANRTFTFNPSDVNVVSDTITKSINGLVLNQPVVFSSTGTLPGGLTAGVVYYIVNPQNDTFQVATLPDNLPINLTTQGTGVHTLKVQNPVQCYGWINYAKPVFQPDSTTKLRSSEANNNVYFTTSQGIQKLDAITGTIVLAGAPPGLDGFATLNNGSTGFLPDNVGVAYRVVWGYIDANKNTILGVPSQRILIANTSGTSKDVDLNITVPQGVTTSYFYQVYRSGFSANANTEPNDEMALVYQTNPTATDLTNEFVAFTDSTPESLRTGAALYTSPSQQGILQANAIPPFARDLTLFKGSTFYANTKTKQNMNLSILSVSGQFVVFGDTDSVNTPTTIRNISYAVTGDLTATSNQIDNVSDVSSLYVGQTISDTTNPSFIPAGTVISQIVDATTIIISNPATTSSIGDSLDIGVVGVSVGQIITGTGIPASTVVTQVYQPFTITGDTNTSTTLTNITSTAGFLVGQPITGTDIPANTTVTAILSATSVSISQAATGSTVGVTFSLENGIQISNPATATNAAVSLTLQNGQNGIKLGDTVTIATTTYTAANVEDIAAKQFKLYTQGSPAQNIADTALSLVRVINRTTAPTPSIYAFYQSGFNDLPGQMLFQERIFGGGIFYATANSTAAGMAYSPNLPGPGGVTVSSQNDEFANGLYFSKTQQPDAVPLLNSTRVGSAQAAILRIIPLRDSLFILKEDGIFRLTGNDPNSFVVDLFDATTILLAPESAVSLNNLIFCLSKYGVVTVSDTSVEVISRPIEDKMLDLFEANLTAVKQLSFGISYESDRKYILFSITTSGDPYPTQAYVYNTFTQTWTRWIRSHSCGLVHPKEDLLYLGSPTVNTFDIERKKRDFTDYTDSSFTINMIGLTGTTSTGSSTISSIANTVNLAVGDVISGIGIPTNAQIISIPSGTSVILNKAATASDTTTLLINNGKTLILDDLSNISIGDAVYQADSRYSIITEIDNIHNTVTVHDFIDNWVLGSTFIYKSIPSVATYSPVTADNPGALKQYRESVLLMQVPFFNEINLGFSTDLASGMENVTLNGLYGEAWGRFPWGRIPWGGPTKPVPIRTYVPLQKQRCSLLNVTLTHNEAYSYYRLNGMSFTHNNYSERVGR